MRLFHRAYSNEENEDLATRKQALTSKRMYFNSLLRELEKSKADTLEHAAILSPEQRRRYSVHASAENARLDKDIRTIQQRLSQCKEELFSIDTVLRSQNHFSAPSPRGRLEVVNLLSKDRLE
jgi:primosomal protein N''